MTTTDPFALEGGCDCRQVRFRTASRQPWVVIPQGHAAVAEYYDAKPHCLAESLQRRKALRAKI